MKKTSAGLLFALMLTTVPVFAQNSNQVNVRLIHAVPTAPAVSVSIGATTLFSDVAYNQVTPFKTMPQQDDKTIVLNLADGRQLKTTEQLEFDDNDEQYTILVTPSEDSANPKVVVLEGDQEDVDQDEVEITLINAAPGQKSIKLLLNDDTEARGVNYAEADDTDVKPGSYNIKVVNADGVDQIIATKSVTLVGGTAVTVLVTGTNSVQILNDASPDKDLAGGTAGAAGMATTTGTGMMSSMEHTTGTNMMSGMGHTTGTSMMSSMEQTTGTQHMSGATTSSMMGSHMTNPGDSM